MLFVHVLFLIVVSYLLFTVRLIFPFNYTFASEERLLARNDANSTNCNKSLGLKTISMSLLMVE